MNNYEKALKKIKQDQKCRPSLIVGPTGPKGMQGPPGPQGIQGEAGPQGIQGVTGPAGTSVSILGSYDTYDDLIKNHPVGNENDSYLVDGDLYVWSDNNSWTNVGRIQGPTGPAGLGLIRTAYLVTFNDSTTEDGVKVVSNGRIPLERIELDVSDLISLYTSQNTIQFNVPGYYKISFKISAYPEVQSVDFNPDTDIVSVGFRQVGTDNVYVGVGQWVYNGEAIELTAQGIAAITNPNNLYELVNLSKVPIFLNTPKIENIASISYFSNSLVTIVFEYLGKN